MRKSLERKYAQKELLIINELSIISNEGFESSVVFDHAVELILEVFGFNNCVLFFLNNKKSKLILDHVSLDEKFIEGLKSYFGKDPGKDFYKLKGMEIPVEEAGVFKDILENKEYKIINRDEAIAGYKKYPKVSDNMEILYKILQDDNVIRIPLVAGKDVFGILSISKEGKFNQDDIDCLMDISVQLALIKRRYITERKVMANELKYRSLFQNAGDPILMLDIGGKIIEFNNKACDVYGYGFQEMIGKDFRELDAKMSPKELKEKCSDVVNFGFVVFESKHKRKDGSVFDVLVTGTTIVTDGEIVIQLINKDITEIKEISVYQEKEKQLDLYVGAIDLSAIPMVLWHLNDIVFANKKMTSLTGYTNRELKQMSLRDLIRKEDLKYFDSLSEFLLANNVGKIFSAELTILNKKGDEKYIILNQVKTDMGNGDPIFSTTIIDKNYTSEKLDKISSLLKITQIDIGEINCGSSTQ